MNAVVINRPVLVDPDTLVTLNNLHVVEEESKKFEKFVSNYSGIIAHRLNHGTHFEYIVELDNRKVFDFMHHFGNQFIQPIVMYPREGEKVIRPKRNKEEQITFVQFIQRVLFVFKSLLGMLIPK